jgi:serine/threonine protein kinase
MQRNIVINEAIVGGLSHPGIVGALAITTDDPPTLVFDYFNGGTLCKMFDKVKESNWPMLKSAFMEPVEVNKMKMFMENRIGICFSLLETMESLHKNERLHCDLHSANVLLHYLYDNEGSRDATVLKVMVGICDWGRAMYLSDAPNYIPKPVRGKKKTEERKQFPQLAPELICEDPSPYSEVTDVYVVGRLVYFIMSGHQRYGKWHHHPISLSIRNWESRHQMKMDEMIEGMTNVDPEKRKTISYWVRFMLHAFEEFSLKRAMNTHFWM